MKRSCFIAFAAGLLLLAACGHDSGNFRIMLTDEPIPDATAIMVDISSISVHATGGAFQTVMTGPQTVNLLRLQGEELQIANTELAQGSYTEIRLEVTSGNIVIGGETFEMTVPSSEVKIPVQFEVTSSGATRILLDFDAAESIQVVHAGQSGGYILRPVIKVMSVTF